MFQTTANFLKDTSKGNQAGNGTAVKFTSGLPCALLLAYLVKIGDAI
jgi:hypothetical protein